MSAAPAPNGRTFPLAPEILSALRQGRQAREREVQGGASAPPVNQPPPRVAEPIVETIGVVDLPQNMPQVPFDVGGAEMSQGQEKKLTKKRVRKRWAGLSSVQVRLRFPAHIANRLGDIPLKQKARAIAMIMCADELGISLSELSSPELRREMIKQGCSLNQAARELSRIRALLTRYSPAELGPIVGRIDEVILSIEACLVLLARLKKAGAL